ncbi:hypothetical protein [Corynebacterium sp. H78]|uniref:hypothetical protein n=1 Tax=Corynebacterium sp. H78 TaxID=3133417 RepID=UPI0030A2B56A
MKRTVIHEVWTPTQHLALWLGAWVTGHEGYDFVYDALGRLGGPGALLDDGPSVGFELTDATIPDVLDADSGLGRADFLRLIRAVTDGSEWSRETEPPVRLILSGAGDPPLLPAGLEVAREAAAAGAAIVVKDAEPEWSHIIVPAHGGKPWQWFSTDELLPQPHHLGIGEADYMLAEATRQTAATIAAMNPGASAVSARGIRGSSTPDPQLMVGMLDDHFDLAHIPDAVPRRAASLIARADKVASIVTVAQGAESGVGSATFDPQLIPLWCNIRMARIAAVDYAVREWTADF